MTPPTTGGHCGVFIVCSSDIAMEQMKYVLDELVPMIVEHQSFLRTLQKIVDLPDWKTTKK